MAPFLTLPFDGATALVYASAVTTRKPVFPSNARSFQTRQKGFRGGVPLILLTAKQPNESAKIRLAQRITFRRKPRSPVTPVLDLFVLVAAPIPVLRSTVNSARIVCSRRRPTLKTLDVLPPG